MQTIQCPKCPQTFAPKFAKIAQQHATWHAGIERRNAERRAADAACTATYGPPKR